jgi:hypothetical protein
MLAIVPPETLGGGAELIGERQRITSGASRFGKRRLVYAVRFS